MCPQNLQKCIYTCSVTCFRNNTNGSKKKQKKHICEEIYVISFLVHSYMFAKTPHKSLVFVVVLMPITMSFYPTSLFELLTVRV